MRLVVAYGRFSLLACAVACTPRGAVPAAGNADAAAVSAGASKTASNLLKASTFDDGVSTPWTTSFTAPAEGSAQVENGALCVSVANKGTNAWDAQFRHREMVIQRG